MSNCKVQERWDTKYVSPSQNICWKNRNIKEQEQSKKYQRIQKNYR